MFMYIHTYIYIYIYMYINIWLPLDVAEPLVGVLDAALPVDLRAVVACRYNDILVLTIV